MPSDQNEFSPYSSMGSSSKVPMFYPTSESSINTMVDQHGVVSTLDRHQHRSSSYALGQITLFKKRIQQKKLNGSPKNDCAGLMDGSYRHPGLQHSLSTKPRSSTVAAAAASESAQLREAGPKVNHYLDSGYSEEDNDQHITSCLMKTSSGSVYIPTNKPKSSTTMDSRLEYRFGVQTPCHSPTKENFKHSERSTLQYSSVDTPFLPLRNNIQQRCNGQANPHLDKRFGKKCSWKCVAIFFVALAIILSAALAYITASSFLTVSYESAKACAVVVDGQEQNDVATASQSQAKDPHDILPPSPPPAKASTGGREESEPGSVRPRNLPPDGTTFKQISLGSRLSQKLPAYGYWNVQFYQMESSYVNFDLNVPRGASLGLYARKNALPTHTNYDIMEVVKGVEDHSRPVRSVKRSVEKKLAFFLSEGHWFISLYNDFGDELNVDFLPSPSLEMTEGCPNGCSGKGECVLGRCQCWSGYVGDDCNQGSCPVLCGGHGDYVNGECSCHPGWKGKECSLRHDECEVSDCSGHGLCQEGKCQCLKGFTGDFCQKVDCLDPSCSGHGFCVEGVCICKKGWKGPVCSLLDEEAQQCLPDCSSNGKFDLETQSCVCFEGWVGDDCSSRLCDLDCGEHGRCEDTSCVCSDGWTGTFCQDRSCDSRCSLHGQCKNGTCLCVTGWNGLHCTLEGCPRHCSNHGSCKADLNGDWSCQCQEGWEGEDCSVSLERSCSDGADDDQDGLVDCEDPDCCQDAVCKNSQLCTTVARPIDILLQRQPPSSTASFFQKMRFIIEEGSLQRYAKNTAFNESLFWNHFNQSRAAVIRGRVVTSTGRGLVGVRVTHADLHNEGYTMTQEDGWFDFMVNGGGAVTLKFGKSPFPPQIRTLFAPWNEVIVIEPVMMRMKEGLDSPDMTNVTACLSHDYDSLRPVVMASWRLGALATTYGHRSSIFIESRVLREVIAIPNSAASLVHHSGRARGYLSTIELRLTPDVIPATLKTVRLRITIEGVLFEKIFEADPNLKYTYSWHRLNIYRQRVFGTTTAVVKVGYEYDDCHHIIWNTQATKISGQDLSVSDLGGWDLNLHHRYNPQDGILYKGDGSNVFLRERPRLISDIIGDGKRRNMECADAHCFSGEAKKQRLLSPVALAAATDGSLFVGDYNLIRKVRPDGTVITVLKLQSSGSAYRYHMALSPHDDTLYVSDPESHRVIRVINHMDPPEDVETNFEVAIGSGIRCLPGDGDSCGDGGPALQARLYYPKGICVSSDRKVYLADGTNIRIIDSDGIIDTLIGSKLPNKLWKPLGCSGMVRLEDAALHWPTEMAINPLDDSLNFVDDGVVAKVTTDKRLQIIAGRPLHCRPTDSTSSFFSNFASQSTLVSPTSISFSLQGDLFLAESDSRRINRVSVISTDSRIRHYAGKSSKCNCQDENCQCHLDDVLLATEALFGSISSLSVSPDGRVFIADQTGCRVRAIESNIPELSSEQEYHVYSPETQEVYVFNRFGLHSETKSITSGKTIYKFSYSVSTSNGKLISIEDASGGKLKIIRDYSGQPSSIENSLREKFALQLDRKRMLTRFMYPDGTGVSFSYTRSNELIHRRHEDSEMGNFVYEYNNDGRLTSVITASGNLLQLKSDLDARGAMVNVTLNGATNVIQSLLMQPDMVQEVIGGQGQDIKMDSDRSFEFESKSGQKVLLKTSSYPLLEIDGVPGACKELSQSYPVPVSETTSLGKDTVSRLQWQYYVGSQPGKVGKRLRVSGEHFLTIELNRQTESQVITLENVQAMINASDNGQAVRISMLPSGLFAGVSLEKNILGQPIQWRWGDMEAEFQYDNLHRLVSLSRSSMGTLSFLYPSEGSKSLPEKVVIPSGGTFVYHRNEVGGLEYVMTPRGHIHGLSMQFGLNFRRYIYSSPWSRHPYELHVDFKGRIIAKVLPEQKEKVIFVYDKSQNHLETVLGGQRSMEFKYYPETGLPRVIKVAEELLNFKMKIELRYHLGVLKEQQLIFDRDKKNSLDSVIMRYTYDGNARLAGIVTQIGQQDPDSVVFKYKHAGKLEVTKDLRIRYESLRRTIIEDVSKSFSCSKDLDVHGRVDLVMVRINNEERYRVKYSYNSGNRISSKKISLARGSPVLTSYTYNVNGQLESAKSDDGIDDWSFNHDVNGNVINVRMGDTKIHVGLDGGDRVVTYSDVDFVVYDERGYVIRRGNQRYQYNAFGQMISAHEPGKFVLQFYYDDLGRIIAKKDHRGNFVQFIYSNPTSNSTVSYVHYPKASRTYRLLYDENNHLVAMDAANLRYYIVTDHLGSPVAVFDDKGKLVKEIARSPFGRIIRDTNPSLDLVVDFAGGLMDQYAHLIHIQGRIYDPLLGQWMTPAWEEATLQTKDPFKVFAYRFHNNDPINLHHRFIHMTSVEEWLTIFSLNLPKLFGPHFTSSDARGQVVAHQAVEISTSVGLINQKHLTAQNLLDSSMANRKLVTMIDPTGLPSLTSRLTTKASAFGRRMLLSDANGKVVVSLLDEGSSPDDVVQSVFVSILNASHLLEASHSGNEAYYFVKSDLQSFQSDYAELQRLSGTYNISYDSVKSSGEGKELCAANRIASVCVLYGLDKKLASKYVHRKANKMSVMQAWKREVEALKDGSTVLTFWTPAERMELQQRGEVLGYHAVEIHSSHRYPQLLGQISNIKFVKDDDPSDGNWQSGRGKKQPQN